MPPDGPALEDSIHRVPWSTSWPARWHGVAAARCKALPHGASVLIPAAKDACGRVRRIPDPRRSVYCRRPASPPHSCRWAAVCAPSGPTVPLPCVFTSWLSQFLHLTFPKSSWLRQCLELYGPPRSTAPRQALPIALVAGGLVKGLLGRLVVRHCLSLPITVCHCLSLPVTAITAYHCPSPSSLQPPLFRRGPAWR